MTMLQSFFLILYVNSALSVYVIGKIKEVEQYEKNEIVVDIITMEKVEKIMEAHKIYAVIPFLNTFYTICYLLIDIFRKKID